MKPIKDSDNADVRFIVVLVTMVLAGLFLPQETLSRKELFLLWAVLAVIALLWFQAGMGGTRDY